jgi:hypothetical protein
MVAVTATLAKSSGRWYHGSGHTVHGLGWGEICIDGSRLHRRIFAAAGDMQSADGWEGRGTYKVFVQGER